MPPKRPRPSKSPGVFVIGSVLTACCLLYFIWSASKMGANLSSPPTNRAISVLSLSQNRIVVRAIDSHVQPHGYSIGGVLESDPFSTKDLALALRVLEPRPRAVVVGRGYSEEEAHQTRGIFAEYVEEVGAEDGIVIKITDDVFDEVGKEGVPQWVLQQLQEHFGKQPRSLL